MAGSPGTTTDDAPPRPVRRVSRGPVSWTLRLCLLVANHVSVLDPLACGRLVWDHGRVPRFLAKEAVFRGATRDPDWWPMQARTGVARLALTTDALVLPVARWGPQRVHDYHTGRLHLRLRTPVDHLVGEPADLLMTRVRDQLAEIRQLPPPGEFHPRPRLRLPGHLPGAAA